MCSSDLGALFFSVMTMLVGRANSIPQLLALRFIAGMGLGSIIPNATALIGELHDPAPAVVGEPGHGIDVEHGVGQHGVSALGAASVARQGGCVVTAEAGAPSEKCAST